MMFVSLDLLRAELAAKARRITGRRNFDDLVNEVVEAGLQRFYDLEYPAPSPGQHFGRHQAEAEKKARNWVGRVLLKTGTRDFAEAIVVEARSNGSIVFHVFLGGCDWEKFEEGNYLNRWRRRNSGRAFGRPLDPSRLRGLLRFFVMKLGCPIDILTRANTPRSTFRRADSRSVVFQRRGGSQ